MELACTHPRTSALPGAVEIELIKEVPHRRLTTLKNKFAHLICH
jgi:hypothetical protein